MTLFCENVPSSSKMSWGGDESKEKYHVQPYAIVDLNPMPESTLFPRQGLWILASGSLVEKHGKQIDRLQTRPAVLENLKMVSGMHLQYINLKPWALAQKVLIEILETFD